MNLDCDSELIERALAPYLIGRHAKSDPQWRDRWDKLDRKWRRKNWKRRALGWIPVPFRRSIGTGGRRTPSHVQSRYEEIWGARPVQSSEQPLDHKPIVAEWRDEGLLVRRGALHRVHLALMARVIEKLAPASVLEVGCGDGRNLFAMASHFPQIAWRGIELSQMGVERGRAVQSEPRLPENLVSYMPWEAKSDTAFKDVVLEQGNACALPLESKSVDMIMTHLSIEQMNPIREQVMAEIARVAKHHVLFLEPFADFNKTEVQRNFVAASDYLSMPLSDLPKFGIDVIASTDAFPQKSRLGQGLVLGAIRG